MAVHTLAQSAGLFFPVMVGNLKAPVFSFLRVLYFKAVLWLILQSRKPLQINTGSPLDRLLSCKVDYMDVVDTEQREGETPGSGFAKP